MERHSVESARKQQNENNRMTEFCPVCDYEIYMCCCEDNLSEE